MGTCLLTVGDQEAHLTHHVDGQGRELVVELAGLQLDDQPCQTWVRALHGCRE